MKDYRWVGRVCAVVALRQLALAVAVLAVAVVAGAPRAQAQSLEQLQADCMSARQAPQRGIPACTALIQSGQRTPENLSYDFGNRGDAYLAQKDYAHAIADFDQSIQLNQNNTTSINDRQIARQQMASAAPAGAQGLAQLGADCDRAAPAVAIEACTALIQSGQLTPENLYAPYNNRGNAYAAQKNYTRAIADYDQAIKLNPKIADAYNNRGVTYADQKNYASAIVDFSQAIALNPQYWEAFISRGAAYMSEILYDPAIADFTKVIALKPGDADAYHNRGLAYADQKNYASAIADFSQAIKLNPQNAGNFNQRGIFYAAQKKYISAMADFDQAVKLNPKDFVDHNNRCWYRALANRELDVARAACDAALRIVPKNDRILDSRGLVGLKQGRFQEAWNDYNAAVLTNATAAEYVYGRGIAALRLGRTAEGQADLARATKLDAHIAETYVGYGVTPSSPSGPPSVQATDSSATGTPPKAAPAIADAAFQATLKTLGAGELFAKADELDSQGQADQARVVRRALIARFPDSPLAATAAQQLAAKSAPH